MSQERTVPVDHRRQGIELFNAVWSWLEKTDRTTAQDDTMLNAAHASRYHWGEVGTAVNLVRGEWQISRVYSVLKRPEPALYHARRCLEICQANAIGDFDLAYAYEALARASDLAGNTETAQTYLAQAEAASKDIAEDDDKELFEKDIQTLKHLERV